MNIIQRVQPASQSTQPSNLAPAYPSELDLSPLLEKKMKSNQTRAKTVLIGIPYYDNRVIFQSIIIWVIRSPAQDSVWVQIRSIRFIVNQPGANQFTSVNNSRQPYQTNTVQPHSKSAEQPNSRQHSSTKPKPRCARGITRRVRLECGKMQGKPST